MTNRPTVSRIVDRIEFRRIPDHECDLSWLEQDCFNHATDTEPAGYGTRRIAAYERGEWYCLGVTAALIAPDGRDIDESPGLWGVESDSDQGYLDDVAEQELAYLASVHGLTADQLSALPTAWVGHD